MKQTVEEILTLPIDILGKVEWEILYLNGEISFEKIPKDKISLKSWQRAVLTKTIRMQDIQCFYDLQNLARQYYHLYGTLDGIIDRYITKEMVDDYFERNITLKHIPMRFITSDMALKAFEKDKDTTYIPNCFWTEEMAKADFEKYGDISRIPAKFITTQEMATELYRKTGDIWALPFEFRTEQLIADARIKNPDFFNQLIFSTNVAIIAEEILAYNLEEPLYDYLKAKYNIKSKLMDDIKFYIEHKAVKTNPDLQAQLKKIKLQSKKDAIEKTIELSQILDTLDITNEFQGLTKKQKIQCAYLIGQTNIETKLSDICTLLYADENLLQEYNNVMKFIRNILHTHPYEHKSKRDFQDIGKVKHVNATWLNEYDYEKEFYSGGKPNNYCITYIKDDGLQVKIDSDIAQEILEYLRQNNVPTRECIVREAFKEYGQGHLEDFITSLEQGTYISPSKTLIHN